MARDWCITGTGGEPGLRIVHFGCRLTGIKQIACFKEAVYEHTNNTESTINYGKWQVLNSMNAGFGLTQWSPASKYFEWAEKEGLDPYDIDTQLKRLILESKGEIQQWITTANTAHMTFDEFAHSDKPPGELAIIFIYGYERPKSAESTKNDRSSQAEHWYNSIK